MRGAPRGDRAQCRGAEERGRKEKGRRRKEGRRDGGGGRTEGRRVREGWWSLGGAPGPGGVQRAGGPTGWRLAPPSLASLGKIGLGDRITPTPISEPPAQPSSAQSAPIPPWWPSRSSPAPPTTVLCGPRQGWALLPWLALALFFPLRAGSPSPPQGRRLRSARGPPGSWAGQRTPRPWAGQRTPEAGRG